MKIKNILTFAFVAVMLMTMTVMVGAAEPTTPVAKIGDDTFTTLEAALAALDENETLELYTGEYDAFEVKVDNVTITGATEDTVITVKSTSDTAFIGVGGDNVTIEGLKFVVPENCGLAGSFSSRGWLASVIGFASSQYNYGGVEPDGWDVKNCEFINEGTDIAFAIFNVDEYEISGCAFNGFSTGICSMGDGSALGTVSVTNNTFTEVDYPLNVYWGVGGDGELTITGNTFDSPKDNDTVKLLIDDYATRNGSSSSTVAKLTVDNNTGDADTEVVVIDFSKDAVVDAGEGETVINSYSSLETAKKAVEDGEEFYLNYGSSNQTSAVIDGEDVTYTDMNPEGGVAFVDGTFYQTIQEALKAITDNSTLTLLQNITITEPWDCRDYGNTADYGRITESNVTIDGNGKTITFACLIDDKNWYTAFRIESSGVIFKDLTIDISSATSVFGNRVRAISSNAGDLTITDCTFIGSTTLTNSRAIIFGEGAQNSPDTDIIITGCTFTNWRRGVSDNENAKDVGTVSITESTFTNAGIAISASEDVTLADNTVTDSEVSITTYTDEGLSATIEGCEFEGGNIKLGSNKLVNGIDVVMEDNFINVPVTSYSRTGALIIKNNTIGNDAEFSSEGNINAYGNENSRGYDIVIGANGGVKIDYKTTGIMLGILRLKMEIKLRDISVEIIEAEGGKIVVVEPENVKYNKPAVCTIVADEGYAVADVIVDGESVGAVTEYTIEKLKGKHTITAVFEKITADTDGEQ